MFLAIIFLAFGVLALAAAGVVTYFRTKSLRKTGDMRKTGTSSAADASGASPGTLVEVKGRLRCEEPLASEMAGKTCAYYLSQVIREYRETRRDSDGDLETRRRSEVVASNERFAPFAVEDDSGAVKVMAEGAEMDAMDIIDRFDEDDGGGLGAITLGGVTVNLGGGERTIGYRRVERILPVDAQVYVLGPVGANGGISASGERFIVSYRSEEQLGKKYEKDARVLLLVAAGLAAFGFIFAAVGAAAGFGAI